MASNVYTLEHFYRGQTVRAGTPDGDMRLLATSAGVQAEQVAEAIQIAIIGPMKDEPLGALALVRSPKGTFYFVQSQIGNAGQFMTHVVLLPSEILRTLSGNLRGLMPLVESVMPTFESNRVQLQPLSFVCGEAPGAPQQTRAMLGLMTATRNRIQTIETLLSAVITNTPLAILDAPPDVDKRLTMIEGLLALMPSPARLSVTFNTHASPPRRPDVLISFLAGGDPPDSALIYRWGEPGVTGVSVSNDYAHFIASQLRLDTELVLKQTETLTPIAGWRIRLGESLASALQYASQRLKIDNAVLGNQPVELSDAAAVLLEDPTLTDEVRRAYAIHLLKLALPLGSTDHLTQIGRIARGSSDLQAALLLQIEDTLKAGAHVSALFDTLMDWMSADGGVQGADWTAQLQKAAKLHVAALVEAKDAPGLASFLSRIASAPPLVGLAPLLPSLIEQALPLTGSDPALTLQVVTLAAAAYPTDRFQKIFDYRDIIARLPQSIARLMPYLFGTARGETYGLLARAASAFDGDAQLLLAIRLAEIALLRDRGDLVDSTALALLAKAAESSWGEVYDQSLRWVVRNLSTDQILFGLGDDGVRSLLRIFLARRAYNDFATSLINAGRVLYGQERTLNNFADFAHTVFTEANLTVGAALSALKALTVNGLKPLPLMLAHYGALQRAEWSTSMMGAAADLNALITSNPLIAVQAPLPMMLALVQYHVNRADNPSAVRLAEFTPTMAAEEGEGGAQSMLRLYDLLKNDERTREIATNLLRKFIRLLPSGDDRRATARLVEALGTGVKPSLDATLLFKRIFDGLPIEEYAAFLHIAADFLHDTALCYVEKDRVPGLKVLLGDLDALNGGFTQGDRQTLARELIEVGKVVVALVQRQKTLRPRPSNAQLEALVTGVEPAVAPLDVFRSMGGYFSRGKRAPVRLSQLTNPHPLAARTANDLLNHVAITLRLLRGFMRAFPSEGRWKIGASILWDELESLWDEVPLADRRKLVQDLALDLQRLPDYIMLIAESGNPRALVEEDRNMRKLDLGERKPENTLEFYRLASGYFRLRSSGR